MRPRGKRMLVGGLGNSTVSQMKKCLWVLMLGLMLAGASSAEGDLRSELAARTARDDLCLLFRGSGGDLTGFTFTEEGPRHVHIPRQERNGLWASDLTPDPRAIVGVLGRGGVALIDFDQRILSRLDADIWVRQLAISPNRQKVAFVGIYKPAGNGKLATFRNGGLSTYGIHIAVLGSPESISLLVPAPEQLRTARGRQAQEQAWGAVGRALVSWSGDNRHLIYDLDARIYSYDSVTKLTALIGAGRHPQCSPDGKWIAFQSLDGAASLMNMEGRSQTVLMGGKRLFYGLKWSPDSQYLLFDEQTSWKDRLTAFKFLGFGRFSIYRMTDGAVAPVCWTFGDIDVRNYGWAYCPALVRGKHDQK